MDTIETLNGMQNRIDVSNFKSNNTRNTKLRTEEEAKGVLPKRWAYDNDDNLVLIKYEEQGYPNHDLMELMISEFLNLIGVPSVNVRLGYEKTSDGIRKCCVVDNFLDHSKGDEIYNLRGAYKSVCQRKKPQTVQEEINTIFTIFKEIPGISQIKSFSLSKSYIETLLCHYIFDNMDGHLNNIAVVTRQSDDSVRYEKLFDHGISFHSYYVTNMRKVGDQNLYHEDEVMKTLSDYCIQLEELIDRINTNLTPDNILKIINKRVYNEIDQEKKEYIYNTILKNITFMNEKINETQLELGTSPNKTT